LKVQPGSWEKYGWLGDEYLKVNAAPRRATKHATI
jgi:hypothetical protein